MDLPRVTEILRPYTSYDKVPVDILARAAARGTTVHAICAGIAKGAWVPDGMIDPNYLGYVNSFRQWSDAQVATYEVIEKRYADESSGYTGQLDFVVTGLDGLTYLVDLKTSAKPQKTYPVQMAAYNHLLRCDGVRVHAAMIVYLNKDGAFPNIDYIENFRPHWEIFKSALSCWQYFFKKKDKHARARPEEPKVAELREEEA